MSDWQNESERAAMENIVRHLKKPFRLDDTFEVRVMSAVHAEALARIDADANRPGDSLWTRRYSLRFSALGALAMAASVIAVIGLTSFGISRLYDIPQSGTGTAAAIAAPVTSHFVLVNENADKVYLVGDFNGWRKNEIALTKSANRGAWTVSIPLTAGKHEYAFIVHDANGEHWIADPLTPKVEDEFGTESSIVRVEQASSL